MLQGLRRAAGSSILETSPHYRTAIGLLGAALPWILMAGGALQGSKVQSTVSAYYYTGMRDWFVGILWVLGVFLFFYVYRPRHPHQAPSRWKCVRTGAADSWLGKVAGVSALVVALVPTTPPPDSKDVPPTIGTVHGVAAATLFVCLALFPLILFSQSRTRRRRYLVYGWTMVALLALTVAYAFAPASFRESLARWQPILVLETLLITVFGGSWFEKGRELASSSGGERA